MKKGWTQGAYARDSKGNYANSKDPSACEWCLTGALFAQVDEANYDAWDNAHSALNLLIDGGIVAWNDRPGRTQGEVLEVIDKALGGMDTRLDEEETKTLMGLIKRPARAIPALVEAAKRKR